MSTYRLQKKCGRSEDLSNRSGLSSKFGCEQHGIAPIIMRQAMRGLREVLQKAGGFVDGEDPRVTPGDTAAPSDLAACAQ